MKLGNWRKKGKNPLLYSVLLWQNLHHLADLDVVTLLPTEEMSDLAEHLGMRHLHERLIILRLCEDLIILHQCEHHRILRLVQAVEHVGMPHLVRNTTDNLNPLHH